jgi:LmbE family N-acetylglucosaminyl deacetylase
MTLKCHHNKGFLGTILLFLVILNTPSVSRAQVAPKKWTSADIYDQIKKLQVLGTVMYVAAHPDDENTRMISYFANARHMDVVYLSLTRGDGGQNLIGTEIRENLGALRTQELLMARQVDGGKQLFSRANDFGFSKSPAETFRIWGEQEVLSDVVWAFRKVQPDVVINRFSIDTSFDTHGHHTGSAIMSNRAFDMSGNPSVFSEQLSNGITAWQPRRLFHNISWFWFGSQEKFQEYVKREQTISLDAGVFLPSRGKSNDEIAAESRSMHKCQAMGMTSSRGSNLEYLQYLKGTAGDYKPTSDVFEGMNTSWTRIAGGEAIGKMLLEVEREFKYDDPSASVSKLLGVRRKIQDLPDGHWRNKKLEDINKVIIACAGIYLEATTRDFNLNPGAKTEVSIEAINRSNAKVDLMRTLIYGYSANAKKLLGDSAMIVNMTNNKRQQIKMGIQLSDDISITSPYWLNEKSSLGLYNVPNQQLRGLPETPRSLEAFVDLNIEGIKLTLPVPIVHVFANPAKGEIYRPVEVTPSVFVNMAQQINMFTKDDAKSIQFIVKAGRDNVSGYLEPEIPDGWMIEPTKQDFALKQKGEEMMLNFRLLPPNQDNQGKVLAKAFVKNAKGEVVPIVTKSVRTIEYDHIPTQTILSPAEMKVVKVNILKRGTEIGYVMGAGDEVPACLEQIGYRVTELKDADLQNADGLSRFDAIVVGIRAYNTKEKLKFYNQNLLKFVEKGGTMVVQYNTSGRDLVLPQFGPYPFKLGRGRTTEEDCEVRFLIPDHAVLNQPNKITKSDFDGWVQERGLYFLSEWDKNYEAVISTNDVGEKPENGGLVVAKHGKGYYVYTGYSFFRELPSGVAGAYRLFANLLSLGKGLP